VTEKKRRSSFPIQKFYAPFDARARNHHRVQLQRLRVTDLKDDLAEADHTSTKITQTAERKPPKLRNYRHHPGDIQSEESTCEQVPDDLVVRMEKPLSRGSETLDVLEELVFGNFIWTSRMYSRPHNLLNSH
jgi:hypothetical protein